MGVMNSIRRRLGALRRRLAPAASASATDRYFVAQSSSIELPLNRNARRSAPRPQEQRDPGYDDAFEATFLFYDIFWRGGEVVMIGPPLRNLLPILDVARIELDGAAIPHLPKPRELDRVQISSIPAARPAGNLSFDAGWVTAQVTVQRQHNEVFNGRKVLFTLSKNNDLSWIEDWIDFHVRVHGVDAVLIYDNASDRYGPDELLDRMRSIPGILAAVVVPWPYKYGPAGPLGQALSGQRLLPASYARARATTISFADTAAILQIDIDEMLISGLKGAGLGGGGQICGEGVEKKTTKKEGRRKIGFERRGGPRQKGGSANKRPGRRERPERLPDLKGGNLKEKRRAGQFLRTPKRGREDGGPGRKKTGGGEAAQKETQLPLQDLVERLRIGLAARGFHRLPDEPADQRRLRQHLGHLVRDWRR